MTLSASISFSYDTIFFFILETPLIFILKIQQTKTDVFKYDAQNVGSIFNTATAENSDEKKKSQKGNPTLCFKLVVFFSVCSFSFYLIFVYLHFFNYGRNTQFA